VDVDAPGQVDVTFYSRTIDPRQGVCEIILMYDTDLTEIVGREAFRLLTDKYGPPTVDRSESTVESPDELDTRGTAPVLDVVARKRQSARRGRSVSLSPPVSAGTVFAEIAGARVPSVGGFRRKVRAGAFGRGYRT
jgi:hypothetical protein